MTRAEADDQAYSECYRKLSRYEAPGDSPPRDELKACQEKRSDELLADDQAEHDRRADAFRHMGDGFKQQPQTQTQPVNCTSNTYGSTTYTNCR